ncbi:unnamed protein product, partial [Ectocarpus sp. 12 AP-2014]
GAAGGGGGGGGGNGSYAAAGGSGPVGSSSSSGTNSKGKMGKIRKSLSRRLSLSRRSSSSSTPNHEGYSGFTSVAGSEEGRYDRDGVPENEQALASPAGVPVVFPGMGPPAPRGAPQGRDPLSPVPPGAPVSSAAAAAAAASVAAASAASYAVAAGAPPSSAAPYSVSPRLLSGTSAGSPRTAVVDVGSRDRGVLEVTAEEPAGGRVLEEEEAALEQLMEKAEKAANAAEAQKAAIAANRAKEVANRAARAAAAAAEAARKDSDAESAHAESLYADSGFGVGSVPTKDLQDRVWKARAMHVGVPPRVEMSVIS